MSSSGLSEILERIDGRGYKAYRDIQGSFDFPGLSLFVDRVQSDPFAAPSKLRVRVPMEVAQLPPSLFRNRVRRIALEDFLARSFRSAVGRNAAKAPGRQGRGSEGAGRSGLVSIDAGGQEVLRRTAVVVSEDWVEARIEVGLPAAGRRVMGRAADELLTALLPRVAEEALVWHRLPQERAQGCVECVENQEAIRAQLRSLGLVAFVGNGALLPRESGASDRPLRNDEVVPFESPPTLEVTVELVNPIETAAGPQHSLLGMGIPEGVTLIVGGGYHGKSTLLDALERSVYPHIPGDGREWVVSSPDLVKIRAEDGRYVAGVDIRPFIGVLPGGRDTGEFSTEDASGSTSQAANILEAMEAGARGLLLDEDTSATNFMVRDARMQALVHKEHEPITPFVDRVRELYDRFAVSTVLVMGGCGDYFEVADQVLCMREYRAFDTTSEARKVAEEHPSGRRVEVRESIADLAERVLDPATIDPSHGRREVKISAKGRDLLLFGSEAIDLRAVTQLVDVSQTRAVGYGLALARERWMDEEPSLGELLDRLEGFFEDEGLDGLDPFVREGRHPGNFARPRRFEIAAALNRLRGLGVGRRGRC